MFLDYYHHYQNMLRPILEISALLYNVREELSTLWTFVGWVGVCLPGRCITEDTQYTYLFAIWHKINTDIQSTLQLV